MKVKQHLEGIWNQQYRYPSGMIGWLAGERMVRQHGPETAWTMNLLEIQPTDTVLEVGFGAGQGIKLAAEKASNGRVMGIDLSEVMVRVATRRNAQAVQAGRVALSQGNITALPFEDQHFDKIMTIHTFYFWPEPAQALSELYRALKPGGRLVITLSTGKIDARGEVEVWPSLHSALEEQVMPGMQREGFRAGSKLSPVHERGSHWREVALIRKLVFAWRPEICYDFQKEEFCHANRSHFPSERDRRGPRGHSRLCAVCRGAGLQPPPGV